MPGIEDSFSRRGAGALAQKIETYWHGRGYAGIRADVHAITGTVDMYCVRSNIGPLGYPPRQAAA